MKDNHLVLLVAQADADRPIRIRALNSDMANIKYLTVILESDTRPPRPFSVKKCHLVVELLHPVIPNSAEYEFHIDEMEPYVARNTDGAEVKFLKNSGRWYTRLTDPVFKAVPVCEFTTHLIKLEDNPNNWVQQARLEAFTCQQLLDEIERRTAEIMLHRSLYESRDTPVTDAEWRQYDARHSGE